ncbi:MAG: hypothetical protein WC329_08535, partial [Candidatus Omnitrophota bacterium]
YEAAVNNFSKYQTAEGYDINSMLAAYDRDYVVKWFGEDAVLGAETPETDITKTAAGLTGITQGVKLPRFMTKREKEIQAEFDKGNYDPALVDEWNRMAPSYGTQLTADEEFESTVLPYLPEELINEYIAAKEGMIPAEEFQGLYETWQGVKREELTNSLTALMPNLAQLPDDKRDAVIEDYVTKLYQDEGAQQAFFNMIKGAGRSETTEALLRNIMPGITPRDIKIIYGENVLPLNQLTLGTYKLTEQPLEDAAAWAKTDPEGLRRAVRYEGRTPETEQLLTSLYGPLSEDYLNKYFETGAADDFLKGEWLPDALEDYWDLAMQGVGDILTMTGGVADRFGAEGLAEELKLAGSYGEVFAKDVQAADAYSVKWFAQNMARMAPLMLGLLGVSIITAGAGGAIAQSLGAGRFITLAAETLASNVGGTMGEALLEAGDAYNAAKDKGFTDDEANQVFDKVFQQNFALLSGSNSAQYALTFFIPGGKTASFFVRALTYGFDAASEGLEETGQLAIQRAALGEAQRFDSEMLQSFVLGAGSGFAFATAGQVNELIKSRAQDKISQSDYDAVRANIQQYMGQGYNRKEAEAKAWDEWAATDEGQSVITEAAQEVFDEEKSKMIAEMPQATAAVEEMGTAAGMTSAKVNDFVNEFTAEVSATKAPTAVPEFNETYAGIQKSMLEEVPEQEVRIKGKGVTTQITLDDQLKLERARRGSTETPARPRSADEAQAELETLKEELKNDPVANYKFQAGSKKSGKGAKATITKDMRTLEYFISLREGEVGETFTVKQARALNPEKSYAKYMQPGTKNYNRVPPDEVLDDIATELGFEDSGALIEHINALREKRRRIDYLTKFVSGGAEAEPSSTGQTDYEYTPEEQGVIKQWEDLQGAIKEWKARNEKLKAIKAFLVNYIRANIPEVEGRGRYLEAVAKADNDYAVAKIIADVEDYAGKRARAALQKKIRKALEKTTPKYQAGMKKGRFIAEVQSQLDAIRNNIDDSREAATNQIANNIQAYEDGKLTYSHMLIGNQVLKTAGIAEQSVEELQNTLEMIKSLKDFGRAQRGEDIARFNARMDSWVKDIVGVLTGGKGLRAGAESLAKEAALP